MAKKWCLISAVFLLGMSAGHSAERAAYLHVLTSLDASRIAQRTAVEFNDATKDKLNSYASFILAQHAEEPSKNILHISSPLLHRTLCFFSTHFVYEIEKNNLPQDVQVYVVLEDQVSREAELTQEVQRLQALFNRCYHSEVSLAASGLYLFAWDDSAYLNQELVALHDSKASTEVPDIFKNDPILSKIYAVHKAPVKKHVMEEVGDEAVNIMLTGVKEELHQTEMVDIREVAGSIVGRVTTEARKQLGKKIWKQRQALVRTFTKDDAGLFTLKDAQEDTARRLTNLIALPGNTKTSSASFSDKLKNILGDDAKVKFNVGKDKIYAGFTLKFK